MGLNLLWNDKIASIETETTPAGWTIVSPPEMLSPSVSRYLGINLPTGDIERIAVFKGLFKTRPDKAGVAINGMFFALAPSSTATGVLLRVRLYSDAAWTSQILSTGWFSAFESGTPGLGGLRHVMGQISPGRPLAKSFRLDISITNTPSPDLLVCRFMLGSFAYFPDQPKYETTFSIVDSSAMLESAGASVFFNKTKSLRKNDLVLEMDENALYAGTVVPDISLLNFVYESGLSKEIAYSEDTLKEISDGLGQNMISNALIGGWGHLTTMPTFESYEKSSDLLRFRTAISVSEKS